MRHNLLLTGTVCAAFFFLSCQPTIIEIPKIVTVEKIRYIEVPKVVEVCGRVEHHQPQKYPTVSFPRTREQGVKLARWCVVEDACVLWPEGTGSKDHPNCGTDGELSEDCKAIVEVAENNRAISRKLSRSEWDETLALMASRIMGDKEASSQRQAWIKELPANGTEPPSNWRDCGNHTSCKGKDGDWRLYAERWANLRENMVEYWLTGPHDVCPGDPLAEGTLEDALQGAIPKRGFVKYDCGERLWIGGPPTQLAASIPTVIADGD